MKRIDKILADPQYQDCLRQIAEYEKDRIFCHHDMNHFLDVARIAYLLSLEENIDAGGKELIYAAALLHDAGRHVQYADGTPHDIASAKIATEILPRCGFSGDEIREITEAILAHRGNTIAGRTGLAGILYRADKLSRNCFCCSAEKECNWPEEKKNLSINI